MKKIKSLFQRNYESDHKVRNELVQGTEWVQRGEGLATRKWDGTCCMIGEDGSFYKRYDAKHGKTPPIDFLAEQEPDPITGHWPGWVPVNNSNNDQWHRDAISGQVLLPGTYELIGPKIGNNREKWLHHELIPHGKEYYEDCPTDFEGIKEFLRENDIEGIVWHQNNGDEMVKIKKKDFNYDSD